MIEFIPQGTTFDFIKYRRVTAIGSVVLIALGFAWMAIRGANLGIDFAGGSLVHVRFKQATAIADVRGALAGTDLAGVDIQELGGANSEFLIRLPQSEDKPAGEQTESETHAKKESVTSQVTDALAGRFGQEGFEVLRVEAVGPRVGEALRERAILALAFATVMMGIYLWARFEWRFGVGAAIALIHDVFLTVAALVVFNYEFDLTIVAALLTVVGFSVNDTVIISDRIRENMRKDRRSSLLDVVNRSINETLSRTILTTGTTMLVVLALFVLGGNVIHGFAFTLLVGFVVGTYSSIYIASSIVLYFEERYPSAGRRSVAAAA
jgi:preprotein translocase subunit SecF